jgi:hypothetical protein
MTGFRKAICRVAAFAAALALLSPFVGMPTPAVAEEAGDLPKNFQANVMVVTGQPGGPRSSLLEIRLREWTTEEERQQVLAEIKEASAQSARNRNRAVARALRGASRVGSMNLRNTTGWPIRYSRHTQLSDGGQRILLATDRPVSFAEALSAGAVLGDFDVTVVELTLDAEGNGEGTISVGTEVRWNDQTGKLEVTNFSTQPVRLTNLRRTN